MPRFFRRLKGLFGGGSDGDDATAASDSGTSRPSPESLTDGDGRVATTNPDTPDPLPLPNAASAAAPIAENHSSRELDSLPVQPPQSPAEMEVLRIRSTVDRLVRLSDGEASRAAKDEALDAVSRLEQWCNEEPAGVPSSPQDTGQYVKQAWKLMGQYRVRRMYDEALRIWALVLGTTLEIDPEVIRLAAAVGREYHRDNTLQKAPFNLWTFGIAIEAISISESGLSGTVQSIFKDLFNTLEINWKVPRPKDNTLKRLQTIDRLLPLLRLPPNEYAKRQLSEYAERLSFWAAIGRWRWDRNVTGDALRKQFRSLAENGSADPEDIMLYRWCQARIRFDAEVRLSPQWLEVASPIVSEEVSRWDSDLIGVLAGGAVPQLATYFRVLTYCERGLKWRQGNVRLVERDIRTAHQVFGAEPSVVRRCRRVREHVAPIVKAIDDLFNALNG